MSICGEPDQLTAIVGRLLEVIDVDIVPLTAAGVAAGNKLFGAAILRRSDLALVVAATNNEVVNPLWHGEIHAIKKFFELSERPAPEDCIFLATHEPCSLCLSGITWSGFNNFYYLFSHTDSADQFAIGHDIDILTEVYAVPDPDRTRVMVGRDYYNRENSYFTSVNMMPLAVGQHPDITEKLVRQYARLSDTYQQGRGGGNIALA